MGMSARGGLRRRKNMECTEQSILFIHFKDPDTFQLEAVKAPQLFYFSWAVTAAVGGGTAAGIAWAKPMVRVYNLYPSCARCALIVVPTGSSERPAKFVRICKRPFFNFRLRVHSSSVRFVLVLTVAWVVAWHFFKFSKMNLCPSSGRALSWMGSFLNPSSHTVRLNVAACPNLGLLICKH